MSSLIQTVQQLSQAMAGLEAQAPKAVCDQKVALRSAWEALRAAAADLQREDQAVKTALAVFQQERRNLEAQRALLRQQETEITSRLRSVAAQETRLAETVAGQMQAQTIALRQEKEKLAGQLQEAQAELQTKTTALNKATDCLRSHKAWLKDQATETERWRKKALSLSREAQRLMVEIPLSCLTRGERAGLIELIDTDNNLNDLIAEALHGLAPNQVRAIQLRFGLDGQEPHTLPEVGKALGLNPDAGRQVVAQALQRMRRGEIRWRLRDYLSE